MTAGLLVLALAGGIAWTRVDTTDNPRITLPAATSTTTGATPISQTTVMGKWRPVSIAGYTGPLTTPNISFDGRGSWSAFDGCNELSGTYRLDENGVRFGREIGSTTRGCGAGTGRADFGPIVRAARSELRDNELTFLAADGSEIARFVRPSITARIELPSTTMSAGSSMTAQVIVENDTGHEIHTSMCGSFFQVELRNGDVSSAGIWTQCAVPLTIPVGESRYPVTLMASYGICAADLAGVPPCLPTGPRPLPPGEYQANLLQSSPVVSLPLPIEVTVTAQ